METATPYNSDSGALEQNADGKNTEVTETPWTTNALTVFNNNRYIFGPRTFGCNACDSRESLKQVTACVRQGNVNTILWYCLTRNVIHIIFTSQAMNNIAII